MVAASSLQVQTYRFNKQLPSGLWSWSVVMDLSGPSTVFRVEDVLTPFGPLRDSVPLPGDVVTEMSDTIETLLTNFPATISVSPTGTLTLTVDEGRGFSAPVLVNVTNTGVFGSILDATLTTSSTYLHVFPEKQGSLASQEVGTSQLSVDSSSLLAVNSPYTGSIAVTAAATNSPQTMPISIVVRPLALIAVNPQTLTFHVLRNVDGSFSQVPAQALVVTNAGPAGSVLSWQIQPVASSPWLVGIAPTSGTLTAGGSESILVSVLPTPNLLQGSYTETVRISGYSSNQYLDIQIVLVVS